MADNTQQNGTDIISTDDLGTFKVQRIKVQYGADGTATDVSNNTPLPVISNSYQANTVGNITSSTSVVTATDLTGIGSATVQINGTFAGVNAIFEASVDGVLWVSIPALPLAVASPTPTLTTGTIASGTYVWNVSPLLGITQFRVRATNYTSGTAIVTIHPSVQYTQYNTSISGGSTTITAITAGTASTSLGKARDGVAGGTDTVIPAAMIRRDAPTAVTPAAGDWEVPQISSTGQQWVTNSPSVGGGWNYADYQSQGTTTQTVKGTAGTFGGYYIYNPNQTVTYLQVFNVASATTVTLGTTNPDLSFGIPPGGAANIEIANGLLFNLGIKIACTTTPSGNTAPVNGLDLNIWYK